MRKFKNLKNLIENKLDKLNENDKGGVRINILRNEQVR